MLKQQFPIRILRDEPRIWPRRNIEIVSLATIKNGCTLQSLAIVLSTGTEDDKKVQAESTTVASYYMVLPSALYSRWANWIAFSGRLDNIDLVTEDTDNGTYTFVLVQQ
jgi:hypothetical protein